MNQLRCILMLVLLVVGEVAYSQDGNDIAESDFETWSSLNFDFKANKRLSFNLEQQIRLKENSSEIDVYFTELSTNYEFNKHVYAGVGLRFIRKNDNTGKIQGYENHGRVNFDLGYKTGFDRFDIGTRLRFQSKNEWDSDKEEGDFSNNHLRFKTSLAYNIRKSKIDPEISAEIFRHYQEDEESEFNKYRLTLGAKYRHKRYGKMGVFYRLEKEINTDEPKLTHILGLKYTYTFKYWGK